MAENGFQDFVENNLEQVLGIELFLIKESTVVKGSIDFLGFDAKSRLFLIEVKCHYDSRSKFEVVF